MSETSTETLSARPFDPDGAKVLITGSSSGLGAALAQGLAQRGAIVGLCARSADRLDEVLQHVRESSPESRAWTVDLADLDNLERFASEVTAEMGGLDLLVNNAGMPKRRWAWQHRPDEITDVLRLNVESPIRLTNALLGTLAASRGHVVMIGSVAARLAPPSEAVYAASKAALSAYAESLRVDLGVAGTPVGVHVVQPGVLNTALFELPDNDPPLSDIEPLEPDAIMDAVLDALSTGAAETYVPDWFRGILPVKADNLDGFLSGASEYAIERIDTLGLARPTSPEVTT
ncbi:MAG: SDR family NAD(P)-dependent oxidoreductase [Microthrixaceae bacterium]